MPYVDKKLRGEYARQWTAKNIEKSRAYSRKSQSKYKVERAASAVEFFKRNPHKYLHRNAKQRAKKVGIVFLITVQDCTVPPNCPCCSCQFSEVLNDRAYSTLTLDRLDSTKGYTPENVSVICWRCNRLKNNGTLKEFQNLVNWLRGLNENKEP